MSSVVIPLPHQDFDITEVVVPWRAFRDAGHEVVFATGDGQPGTCDPLLIDGPLFGKLGAKPENVGLYRALEKDPSFCAPIRYTDVSSERFAALLLPGGHAKGMRPYLEDAVLQQSVVEFFHAQAPVGAICHGSLVLARSIDPDTGRSVIAGRRVSALTRRLEWAGWAVSAWKLGDYYRTYPKWVQTEVSEALGALGHFDPGPFFATYTHPWCIRDGKLVTARWPGDAEAWAAAMVSLVEETPG